LLDEIGVFFSILLDDKDVYGWYSNKNSQYLNDEPGVDDFNQMNKNIVTNWKLLHLPTAEELPYYGDWWNWNEELQIINRVIDYLGETLGKFETHFI
jgi:hypothetical protein